MWSSIAEVPPLAFPLDGQSVMYWPAYVDSSYIIALMHKLMKVFINSSNIC